MITRPTISRILQLGGARKRKIVKQDKGDRMKSKGTVPRIQTINIKMNASMSSQKQLDFQKSLFLQAVFSSRMERRKIKH